MIMIKIVWSCDNGGCCMNVLCFGCGITFDKLPNQVKRSKTHYCSRECKTNSHNATVQCDFCQSYITKRKSYINDKNFCDKSCYGNWRSENIVGEKHHFYKGKSVLHCEHCTAEIQVYESKFNIVKNGIQENIFCGRKCKEKWESINWKGENNPNFSGASVEKYCIFCNNKYAVPLNRDKKSKFCSVVCKNKYQSEILPLDKGWVQTRREIAIRVLKNQKNKDTRPERIVREWLESNSVRYIPQHPMFNRFVVDFYLPDCNTVLEVLGDYWHGNPSKYSYDKLTDKQKKNKMKDEIKKSTFESNNIPCLMIWENDIYKDVHNCLKNLL